MPDGRYKPVDKPTMVNPRRIHQRVWLRETAKSDTPTATDERIIVLLWVSRDETNPEPKTPVKKPSEIFRKREPAVPCPMFRSPSIAGNRGVRNILARNVRKKIPVR